MALLAACQPTAPAWPPSAATSTELQYTRVDNAIEVRRGATVLQRLDIPPSAEAPDIEVQDLNFDGKADLRVIDVRPAGPNVSYINWLFDPASQRFVRSEALDELVAPEFDATRREVRSSWRDGATRYGSDIYTFRDGQLSPLTREVKDYSAPGVYTMTRSRWAQGRWQQVETMPGRDDRP